MRNPTLLKNEKPLVDYEIIAKKNMTRINAMNRQYFLKSGDKLNPISDMNCMLIELKSQNYKNCEIEDSKFFVPYVGFVDLQNMEVVSMDDTKYKLVKSTTNNRFDRVRSQKSEKITDIDQFKF